MGCTLRTRSQTWRYDAHCGAWLSGVMHIAESDSAVRSTLRSLTQRCDSHRRVRLGGGMYTVEFFENFWSLDSPQSLTPWWDAHRELDSTVWCTPRSLTPRGDAHCRVRLRSLIDTLGIFLKIRISQRNQNRIRKYFSLFIRGPDGFESWKNWRLKISWNNFVPQHCFIDRKQTHFANFYSQYP